jgi:uncharacterized protein (TIGR02996 family)
MRTMSEHAGFLQAIIEHPDDSGHRLVYADWLDEHGESLRAALIRTQCALQGLMVDNDDPFDFHAGVEVMQLRPELRQRLLAPFSSLLPQFSEPDEPPEEVLASAFRFWVRRGFVEGLEIFGGQTAALFARDVAVVFQRTPLLHLRVRYEASRADMGPFVLNRRLDGLQVRTLRTLIDQECVGQLRTLDLRDLNLRDDAARCLLRCRQRLNLRRLDLSGNPITDTLSQQLRQQFGNDVAILASPDDEIPF